MIKYKLLLLRIDNYICIEENCIEAAYELINGLLIVDL